MNNYIIKSFDVKSGEETVATDVKIGTDAENVYLSLSTNDGNEEINLINLIFGDEQTSLPSTAKNLYGQIQALQNRKITFTPIPLTDVVNKITKDINNSGTSSSAVLTYEGFKKMQDLERSGCLVSGARSSAKGLGTKAIRDNSFAIGQYNLGEEGSLFEIGKGTGDRDRQNAFSVSYSGDGVFFGAIRAASGAFEGTVSATSGVFNGGISATSGTFEGAVSAAGFTLGGTTITSWSELSGGGSSTIYTAGPGISISNSTISLAADIDVSSITLNSQRITAWPSEWSFTAGQGIDIEGNKISLASASREHLGGIKISYSETEKILSIST